MKAREGGRLSPYATFWLMVVILASFPKPSAAASCESLATLSLPRGTVEVAQVVTGGSFTLPSPAKGVVTDLPAFCRVAAVLKPSTDSHIDIEVWMPMAGWNGKFLGIGNGGLAGAISYGAMGPVLKRGYAVASTDTGHRGAGNDASWAIGHPEKQIDFGYRAVHEMTVQAKAIVTAFYAAPPRYAYWSGCSTGGRQGLKEAQRFPADYDGIIAGAPVNNWVHLVGHLISVGTALRKDSGSAIPSEKLPLLHSAVMAQCDALDGVKDGLLENPRRCRFDPAVLQCKGEDQPTCLTSAQVASVQKVYEPFRHPRTGNELFPGFSRGGELAWEGIPRGFSIAENYYKYMVAADPAWDFRTLNYDTDLTKAERIDETVGQLVATDPDLRAFKKRGGKLIQYHGFGEPEIASESSIRYYDRLVEHFGQVRDVDDFYRLYMVPGMGHCRGGAGATDQFDMIAALEQWVERGVSPTRIVASHATEGVIHRTRPLCPYPQVARWKGSGSTDDAVNFECVRETGK